jgi:hypothetical protein
LFQSYFLSLGSGQRGWVRGSYSTVN